MKGEKEFFPEIVAGPGLLLSFSYEATVICPLSEPRTSMAFTTLDMTGFTILRPTMSKQEGPESVSRAVKLRTSPSVGVLKGNQIIE